MSPAARSARAIKLRMAAALLVFVAEPFVSNPCEHLAGLTAGDFPPPAPPNACAECLEEGTVWVALRECRTCGHVGCCDSSTGKHATRHFNETQHAVMRAVPPAAWTWCYVHQVTGKLNQA